MWTLYELKLIEDHLAAVECWLFSRKASAKCSGAGIPTSHPLCCACSGLVICVGGTALLSVATALPLGWGAGQRHSCARARTCLQT
eukprot:6480785-Amphidinium_carterae.1